MKIKELISKEIEAIRNKDGVFKYGQHTLYFRNYNELGIDNDLSKR